tara:strand:+ start:36163 stop:37593 length:1431 start_codon:yes stop_codon:yes gene_type:complete
MSNVKELLKNGLNEEVKTILKLAGEVGDLLEVKVYAVGGIVRDLFLSNYINDVDIMVVGDGIEFAKRLSKKLGIPKIISFEKFGTAIIPNQSIGIEVASARKEVYNNNSRKPEGVFQTDINGDLKRRDFTINSMAIDISTQNFGEFHDPYGGLIDLKKKVIRTPLSPDMTFSDDPLRMMRAAYFSSKLKFDIEKSSMQSMKEQYHRIEIVSWERIRDEFFKILSTSMPSIGLTIMEEAGILKIIFPEIHVMYGMDQTSEWHHKDIFDHTLQVVDNVAQLSDKMELRFAALVHDIAKPITRRVDKKRGYTFHGHDAVGERMISKVADRMKLSKKLSNYLKKLTLLHLRPIALVKSHVTDSAVRRLMVAAGDDLDDLMTLCRGDITTKNPKKVSRYMSNFLAVEKKMSDVSNRDEMKSFQSPIRGHEIMEICGLQEGPKIGAIKKDIERAILDDIIENNYDDAKAYLIKIKNKINDNI